MNQTPKVYVAGHTGMVGSAICRALQSQPQAKIITRTSVELDLTNQSSVLEFFAKEKPDQVYLAAAKVGGIYANSKYPGEFLYTNLMIQNNVINSAFHNDVKKLLFLGSSCIYPKLATQPMAEDALLTGKLEPTNESYAIAKIAGIKLCESYNRQYGDSHSLDYRSVMPTNLYGPGDNYHPLNSHVIPGLIRRFHEAKTNKLPWVTVWGSGSQRREFLNVDDLADACVYVMNLDKILYNQHTQPMLSHINIGCGHDISIKELAQLICKTIGYDGQIKFDLSKPDGTPRKLMDGSRLINMGWKSKIKLEEGLKVAYQDFLNKIDKLGI